jgi:hypothetical protein
MPSSSDAAIAEEGDHLPELGACLARLCGYAPEQGRVLLLGEQGQHTVAALHRRPVRRFHLLHGPDEINGKENPILSCC